jgi:hypothetical protein
MIAVDTNPFQELYVTDNPDPGVFVALFSHYPVRHATALFRPGNVIVKGTQGSGKSMLLNLLKPEIRLAYAQAGVEFPVKAPFIGAGINLTRSGALDMGQRPLSSSDRDDELIFPLYFADFLNYYIVRDILASIVVMAENPVAFKDLVVADKLDEFARELATQDCWFEYLSNAGDFDALCARIDHRISTYRGFHQFNNDLPEEIHRTKTGIGEPIARTAILLKRVGVVPQRTAVLVRIDQVERLYRSDVLRPNLGHQYRRIINKAVGLRDMRVSYRIGTRRYAWEDDLTIYGTSDKLEHIRDFRTIDLDEMLRRREHVKTWIFPAFAEDVFRRRLQHAGYPDLPPDSIRRVFGTTMPAEQSAQQYAANAEPQRVLRLGADFSSEWKEYLEALFRTDPLAATLAAAWKRQKSESSRRSGVTSEVPLPAPGHEPSTRPYWKKERVRQCLLQMAARNGQRLKWAGKEHLLGLSSGNISIFISLSHEIWDSFLRAERRKDGLARRDPVGQGIQADVQAVAIQTAGAYWYHKITEQPKGDDRQRFVEVLGRLFRSWLLDDLAMSYPGHNGFSLIDEELSALQDLAHFLNEAVAYGELYDAPHTTKERDRRRRTKWYLSPILSVYFQIPETHVKEPQYVSPAAVLDWLREAGVYIDDVAPPKTKRSSRRGALPRAKHKEARQGRSLFPEDME